MNSLTEKNVLIIIPKIQFCEEELYGVMGKLKGEGANVVVLSSSGKEAVGMKKDIFKTDGMIVDWDKQPGINGKYNAVILVGGLGAKKSIWNDPIIPQILTDHYRYGSVVAGIGSSIVVLVKASLIVGEVPLQAENHTQNELESLNVVFVDTPVLREGKVILGQGANSVDEFSQSIVDCMKTR